MGRGEPFCSRGKVQPSPAHRMPPSVGILLLPICRLAKSSFRSGRTLPFLASVPSSWTAVAGRPLDQPRGIVRRACRRTPATELDRAPENRGPAKAAKASVPGRNRSPDPDSSLANGMIMMPGLIVLIRALCLPQRTASAITSEFPLRDLVRMKRIGHLVGLKKGKPEQ